VRGASFAFGALNLSCAALIGVGVFVGLPARYAPVDAASLVLIALLVVSGVGLVARARWGAGMARLAAATSLMLGLLGVAMLAVSASYLMGIYGPVGRGGALLLTLVAALVVPYLVALPAVELAWLARVRSKVADPGDGR
jgi:hypothetical protein